MAVPVRTSAMKTIFSILLGVLMLGQSVNSQAASSSSSPSPTSGAAAATHTVNVGLDGFTYSPDSINANVGDIVLFIFYPQNHSVARAEYGHPCIPYENTGPGKVGFWSEFQPVASASENGPKFALEVNSTEPTFFYCSAAGACVPNGMIGVINPNATQTLANQKAFVANSTIQLSPGEQNPSESGASPTPSSGSSSNSGSSSGLSGGAIAGIVVGAVILIALAGLAFYLCGRNRTLASVLRYSQPPPRPQNIPPVPYSPSPARSPYSAEFSPKPSESPTSRPILSSHQSWATQNTSQQIRPTSPEMAGSGGMMSPQMFNPGYGSGGYGAVENPGNGNSLYGGNQSPQASPWAQHSVGFGQSQYAIVPNEIASGREPVSSPGQQSYTSHNSHPPVQEVHELDARSSAPETPGAPPPQYAARTFSFIEGGDAPLGVEKVLRD